MDKTKKAYHFLNTVEDTMLSRILALMPETDADIFSMVSPYFVRGERGQAAAAAGAGTGAASAASASEAKSSAAGASAAGVDGVSDEELEELVEELFGKIKHEASRRVAGFLVANLVYHMEWLQKTIPRTHPLFSSAFTRLSLKAPEELARLKACVSTEAKMGERIALCRGVPSSVVNGKRIMELQRRLDEVLQSQSQTNASVARIAEQLPLTAAGHVMEAQTKQFKAFTKHFLDGVQPDIRDTVRHEIRQGLREAQIMPRGKGGAAFVEVAEQPGGGPG